MSVVLLANTIKQSAVDLRVTDGSDTETTDGAAIESVSGGQRHLSWTQSGTGARRIVYLNKSGGLAADYAVITNADRHQMADLKLRSWTAYPSTGANAFSSSNFNEALIGPNKQDFVYNIGSLTGKKAFALCLDDGALGAYSKRVSQVYFSSGVSFGVQDGDVTYDPVSIHAQQIKHKGQYYLLDGIINCSFAQISKDTLQTYFQTRKDEPVFFYDTAGLTVDTKVCSHDRASNEHLSINDNAALSITGNISFCMWVKPASSGNWMTGLSKYNSSGNQRSYILEFSPSLLPQFELYDLGTTSGQTVQATKFGSLTVGQWYFVLCRWNGSTMYIKINDLLEDTAAHGTSVFDGTAPFQIGAYTGSQGVWDGKTSRVGIWSRFLTEDEGSFLWNNGIGRSYSELTGYNGIKTNLVSYWNLDEYSAGTAAVTRSDSHSTNHLTDTNTCPSASATFTSPTVGQFIEPRLWHAVILSERATQTFDDSYRLSLQLGILRHYA